MTWLLVLQLTSCQCARWAGPPLTPQAAADVLRPHATVLPRPWTSRSTILTSSPTAGPFGEFRPFTMTTALAPDQPSVYSWPPVVYYLPEGAVHDQGHRPRAGRAARRR